MRTSFGIVAGFIILGIGIILLEDYHAPQEPVRDHSRDMLDERLYAQGHRHYVVPKCYANGMRCADIVVCGDSAKVIWDNEHVNLTHWDSLAVQYHLIKKEELDDLLE